jgi:hypothetical protein
MGPGFDGGAGPYARTPKSLETKAGDACGPRARPQYRMAEVPIVDGRSWIEVGYTVSRNESMVSSM